MLTDVTASEVVLDRERLSLPQGVKVQSKGSGQSKRWLIRCKGGERQLMRGHSNQYAREVVEACRRMQKISSPSATR